jgi:hypothetical protein
MRGQARLPLRSAFRPTERVDAAIARQRAREGARHG